MDELNSLIYLERYVSHTLSNSPNSYVARVIQETLRVYSSVTFRHRMAMQDDVLPLSKPYVDKHGIAHTSLL
jgi:cytochrome P450